MKVKQFFKRNVSALTLTLIFLISLISGYQTADKVGQSHQERIKIIEGWASDLIRVAKKSGDAEALQITNFFKKESAIGLPMESGEISMLGTRDKNL